MRCRRFAAVLAVTLLTLAAGTVASAQSRPGAPAAGAASNADLLRELKAIRALLEKLVSAQPTAPAAPTPAPPERATLASALPLTFSMGRPDAPVTMVEFTDLQCPFCRRFTGEAFERIKREYIDTGTLRFISRDLPLDAIHPLARASARVSRCAAEQGKGFQMRHAILANNARLAVELFPQFAVDLGLDMTVFARCTNDVARLDAAIEADMAAAKAAGFSGTPGFLIGLTAPAGLEGTKVSGAQSFETFKAAIEGELARRAAPPARR